MKHQQNQIVINRMKRLIGHAQSNLKMLEHDKYCIDIIEQNIAVVNAIHKVNQLLLEKHMKSCVVDKIETGSRDQKRKVVEELMKIYRYNNHK